jgi:hypothetical protein
MHILLIADIKRHPQQNADTASFVTANRNVRPLENDSGP